MILAVGAENLLLLGLVSTIVLGVAAQWLAWRLRLPAILFLLAAGLMIGPGWQLWRGHKLLDPRLLLGDLLQPIAALSVAIILFEGGLTLNLADLRNSGHVLWRLVTVGALVTWLVGTVAAALLFGIPWRVAALLGAVLIVTGPTVIGPMLRFIRPVGDVGAILKWEGIVIDPIGASLAVLVFQVSIVNASGSMLPAILLAITKTVFFGTVIGGGAAALLVLLLRRYWVADRQHVPVTVMLVLAAFLGSNLLENESGLLAVTVMGFCLANQRFAPTAHISEFKEILTILLIGVLFILLGSRLDTEQLLAIGWRTAVFVTILIVIARPLAVWVSTIGTRLPRRQRLFLAWMAPRGIVAAAVSSIFAAELVEHRVPGAEILVPTTFAVIVATVTVYGLTALGLARKLGLSRPGNRGFVVAGANPAARAIACALAEAGQEVLLADTNRENIAAARMEGLPVFQGNILSEALLRRIEGTSLGRLLAITSNADLNALAAVHFARQFGRSQVFELGVKHSTQGLEQRVKGDVTHELRGRRLFGAEVTFQQLTNQIGGPSTIKRTNLSKEFDYAAFRSIHPEALMLFTIDAAGEIYVATAGDPIAPKPGQSIIALTEGKAEKSIVSSTRAAAGAAV